MVIDNSKAAIRDRKLTYGMLAVFIMTVSAIMLAEIFDKPILGIKREYFALVITFIYVAITLYRLVLNLNYIYYTDNGGKIVLKYYSLRPFMQNRKTIEIPRGALIKFVISESFFEHKKTLVLYQKIKNKTARYPEISLSALTEDEFGKMRASLNAFSLEKE